MKHLSLSGSVAAVVAVVVLFLVATDRVSAANVATFSSLVATGTVSLADTSYQQVWFFDVTAQYVRFVFPFGSSGYYTSRSDLFFTRFNELELYMVPEPASLSLLALGGLALLRRRK